MQLSDLTDEQLEMIAGIDESRLMRISKDDLRLFEYQVLWAPELELEITGYWKMLNGYWKDYEATGQLPPCTCADRENGFLAKEKWNPYFKYGEPCSLQYFKEWKESENVTS